MAPSTVHEEHKRAGAPGAAAAAADARGKVIVSFHGDILALPRTFVHEHPGGEELVREFAGRDITAEFEAAAHSESARQWALSFSVGKVGPATAKKLPWEQEAAGGDRGRELLLSCARAVDQMVEYSPFALALLSITSAALAWSLRKSA
mmetsp:Transcript_72001/g.188696  ORF Transcript_72001/g.188696 Transcript_72001/m.188696 type:complete len:149 (-) Transcript_72001:115-561(-)